jgi:predicted ATPase
LVARCYEGELELAYAPFLSGFQGLLDSSRPEIAAQAQDWLGSIPRHWLSEASRLLPEIKTLIPELPASAPLDGPGAQVRFFEGLRQLLLGALAGDPPGVIFVDDLHWADAASLDLLTYLSRRLRDLPVFILATGRDDLSEGRERLGRLHAEALRNAEGQLIHLNRLSHAEISELVHATNLEPAGINTRATAVGAQPLSFSFTQRSGAHGELGPSLSARLYRESEGLPLIAVQYLQMLSEDGVQRLESAWSTPGGVQVALRSKLLNLDDTACQLLTTAAAIGRSFDFLTLKNASGRSETETVSGLETLLARGLIQERVEGNQYADAYFDFSHEKLREIVYEDTTFTRRRLLHKRIAEVISGEINLSTPGAPEGRDPDLERNRRAKGDFALIGLHFRLAGLGDQAAHYYSLAGEHARAVFANQEAVAHFQAALEAGATDQPGLHEAIADLQTLNGEYSQAIANYEIAASFLERIAIHPLENVRLNHKLGDLYNRLGNLEVAEQFFSKAQEALTGGAKEPPLAEPLLGSEPELQALRAAGARLYADWSRAAHNLGEDARALSMAQRALQLAESSQDQLALAHSHNILGMLARARGAIEMSVDHLERSLRVAERNAEPGARIAALNNLAHVEAGLGHLDKAIAYTQSALDLCLELGDRHREAALRNNLADFYHTLGRPDEAMSQLKQAVVIFAEIGSLTGGAGSEGPPYPAVWMLTEW